MYAAFFDDHAAFVKDGYDRAVAAGSAREAYRILTRTITEYYVRNAGFFGFSLIHVYGSGKKEIMSEELRTRGIDMQLMARKEKDAGVYPSKAQLMVITLTFCVAHFHRYGSKKGGQFLDVSGQNVLDRVEKLILSGLELDASRMAALNYGVLEKQAASRVYEDTEDNKLLCAVAGAVAEAGPWNASMEMVARRSGLSKSGLYAHFKNKQDMLGRLFITEFSRIVDFARLEIESTQVPEEQLYLAIVSIVNYLRSRPEILVAIDWIKTRRLELGISVPDRLYEVIGEIKLEAIQKQERGFIVWIAQWILFMIVNILAWWPPRQRAGAPDCPGWSKAWAKNAREVPDESFRVLFRFIARGLDGVNL
jgi:AcrR family transcriptional regulator